MAAAYGSEADICSYHISLQHYNNLTHFESIIALTLVCDTDLRACVYNVANCNGQEL